MQLVGRFCVKYGYKHQNTKKMARITKRELADLYKISANSLYKRLNKERLFSKLGAKVFKEYNNGRDFVSLPLQLKIFNLLGNPK